VDTIRRTYYLLIFILALILGIFAWNTGTKKATIDSPPLAEVTNDVFQTDIKRERPSTIEGIFENEVRVISPDDEEREKMAPPARERIEPDVDRGIVDLSPDQKRPEDRTIRQDQLLFEESRSPDKSEPEVKRLPSRETPLDDSTVDEPATERNENTDLKDKTDTTKEKKSRVIRSQEPDTSPMDSDSIIIRE
jgi:hypothetical protein